jgi:hypothetical protein
MVMRPSSIPVGIEDWPWLSHHPKHLFRQSA